MTSYLMDIYSNADVYLLIFVRIFGFLTLLPVLGGNNLPTITKIGFALIFSVIIFSTQSVMAGDYGDSIFRYGFLIGKEFIVGLILGFSVFIIFNIVYLIGQEIDHNIGLSMVSVLDPMNEVQVPISGNLFYYIVAMVLLATDGHHVFLNAFFYSYDVLPIGHGIILDNASVLYAFMKVMSVFFTLGLQISMPIIGAILLLDAALGILGKASPQMNIFVVGIPVKLIIGLVLIYILMPAFVQASDSIINKSIEHLFEVIRGLVAG